MIKLQCFLLCVQLCGPVCNNAVEVDSVGCVRLTGLNRLQALVSMQSQQVKLQTSEFKTMLGDLMLKLQVVLLQKFELLVRQVILQLLNRPLEYFFAQR